jgi:hypothetical protein
MAVGLPQSQAAIDLENLPPGFTDPPLRWPDLDSLDLDRVALVYYEPYDLLSVHLLGRPVPAINVPLEPPDSDIGYAEARIGIPGRAVVGIEIMGYRSEVSNIHPDWDNLPDLTGEERRRVLHHLITFVAAMPVHDGPPNA